MWFNTKRPAFADRRIWKAFQLAFDYKETNDAVFGEKLWSYTGPVHSVFSQASPPDKIATLPGFSTATREADITEARKLLAAAGKPNGSGLDFNLTPVASSGTFFDLAVRAQAGFKKVFPDISIGLTPPPDAAAFQGVLNNRNYDAMIYSVYDVTDVRLSLLTNLRSDASRNYGNYQNTDLDRVIDQAMARDGDQLKQSVAEAERILFEDGYPAVMLCDPFHSVAFNKRITGYQGHIGPGGGGGPVEPFTTVRWTRQV
jgi:ABC-type oligopeptide transport system substrate-binding subunit